jgi:hypothetical protein
MSDVSNVFHHKYIEWNANEGEDSFMELFLWFYLIFLFIIVAFGYLGLNLGMVAIILPLSRVSYDWKKYLPLTNKFVEYLFNSKPNSTTFIVLALLIGVVFFEFIIIFLIYLVLNSIY